jgi:diacylglycerol O-acyltransferase / wax synthase
MIHLSGVDASFLHLETPEMPMHVGSMHLLDLPEGYKGDFYEDVVKHVGSRLHLASVFERKLAQMPFEMSNPVWVDDDDIDLEYHIRRVVLSKPGTMEQLEAYTGRLHSSLLDRSRPLWEMYVFEGLENGQVAMYTKVHHAAVDGQAGVALAKALFDITAEPRAVKPPRVRQRSNQYQLGVAELMTAAMQNTFQQYVKLITTLPNAMNAMASVAMPAIANMAKLPSMMPNMAQLPNMMQPGGSMKLPTMADAATGIGLPAGFGFGPRTPLNVSITNQRAFAGRSVSLADAKTAAKKAGVSLNDIVMAACAGALKRYMADNNVTLDRAMTAAIPVSLREAGNTDPNNQVTMMLASLATDIKDPLERLKAIHASTTASKELTGSFKAAIPTDFPSFGAPWIMTSIATLFGRSKMTDQMPPMANVAISNVPGVPVALYIAGAKMATYFPVSIPSHGCALNITVQSYNGMLDYGLTACRRALPDVADIADGIVAAHAELNKLIMALPAAAKPAAEMPAHVPLTARSPAALPAPATEGIKAPMAPTLPTPASVPAKTNGAVPVPVAAAAPAPAAKKARASVKMPPPKAKAQPKRVTTPPRTAAAAKPAAVKTAPIKAGAAKRSSLPDISVSASKSKSTNKRR